MREAIFYELTLTVARPKTFWARGETAVWPGGGLRVIDARVDCGERDAPSPRVWFTILPSRCSPVASHGAGCRVPGTRTPHREGSRMRARVIYLVSPLDASQV